MLRGKFQHQASDFLEHLDAQLSNIGQILLRINLSAQNPKQDWVALMSKPIALI